jgi:glycerol-3-phosphate acyltransferase PlsY
MSIDATKLVYSLAVLLCYLIGAIPFGLLISRGRGVDVRLVGSGNIGATNVGRALGKKYFALVFLLDFLKGFLPTAIFTSLLLTYFKCDT